MGYRQPVTSSEGLADQGDQVDEAVGVAPLVVVPADDLDLIADHLGQAESKMQELGSVTMSVETIASLVYFR